jgi:hypothetical protein
VSLSCVTAVLLALNPSASGARGQQLIRACHHARDDDELHLVIKPNGGCKHSYEELTWNKRGVAGLRGFRGFPGPPGKIIVPVKKSDGDSFRAILELAALAAAVALAGLLALFMLGLAAVHVLSRVPFIKDKYPIRLLRRPSFVVETLDDSALGARIGPAITGLVRSRIGVRGDRLGLDYVTGQKSVRLALKRVKDVTASFQTPDGSAGAALSVIDFMARTLPRRRFVLRGELQPAGQAGSGISLALEDPSGEDSLAVLWARSLEVRGGEVACYRRLAIPAAAWADHRLTVALRSGLSNELVTRNADSWTFFNAGLEAHRLGEDAIARSLYEQALGHDGANVGALANLGLLERRARKFVSADQLLGRALQELEKRHASLGEESIRRNPDWYRIRHQRAILHLNRATWGGGRAARPHDLEFALHESRALALDSLKVTNGPAHEEPASRDVMLAHGAGSGTQRRYKSARGWTFPRRRPRWHQTRASIREEHRDLSAFLQTTIFPCALTLLAGGLNETEPRSSPPIDLRNFEDVRRSLDTQNLDSEELVKFVEHLQELAPRAYYSLACYRATGERRDDAKMWLEQAVMRTTLSERPALLQAVRGDETLKLISDDAAYMERLRRYLRPSP